jgi:ABC-type dipeptide/oligopeptide/nickel transport system permease subunit
MDPRAFHRFRRNKGAVVGLFIVVALALFSLLGPLIVSHGPNTPDFETGTGPFGSPHAPDGRHWLGTDTIFRDVLARLADGGRLSLQVALVATVIAMVIGTGVGVLSGYFKGTRTRIDHLAEGAALANGAVAFLLVLTGHSVAAHRVAAFAGYLLGIALALRMVGRAAAIARNRARILGLGDLIDGAVACLAFGGPIARGVAILGNVRFVVLLLACGAASLAVRALLSRKRRRADRDASFPRVDFDDAVMRTVDVLLAFPFLLLLMAISAAVDRTSMSTIFLVLGLTAWTGTARIIRGKTLQVRQLDFIVASRALGQSTPSILMRHVLPNVGGLAIILATNSVAFMIVAEAALSFLGLSIPPPQASWGRMLDEGRPYYSAAPWLLIAPALAILLAVLGFNLVGEGLRDAFDVKDV